MKLDVLYISFLNEDIRPGYKIKIHDQCKSFRELGYTCFLLIVKVDCICLYKFGEDKSEQVVELYPFPYKRRKVERNIIDEFYLFDFFCKSLRRVIELYSPKLMYIRRIVPIMPKLLGLLDYARSRSVYTVYEYPTYPWKKEMLNGRKYLFYLLDSFFYNSLLRRVDLVACYGKYEGKRKNFTELMNGVSVERYPLHSRRERDYISLIGVAHVSDVHGYDKVIRGLSLYYKSNPSKKVYFHIVGPVPSKLHLRELVSDLHLNDFVYFHGYTTGEALDDLFEEASVGVDSLALNRSRDGVSGSLKSREYLARGIPFIFAGNLDFMMDSVAGNDFILRVPEEDDSVDISKVVDFYMNMKSSPLEIRKYAKDNLSWNKILQKIFDVYGLQRPPDDRFAL